MNDYITLHNNVEAEARKGHLGTVVAPKAESSKAASNAELTLMWQVEEMQQLYKGKGAECNIILQEIDAPAHLYEEADFTDPVEFHCRVLHEQGLLPSNDTIKDTPKGDATDEAAYPINTLYRIGAPEDAAKLNQSIEVLAFLCWSRE